MQKIGGITFHASHNYGSCLQAYAFQEFIDEKFPDFEYKIINFRSLKQKNLYPKPLKNQSLKRFFANIIYTKSLTFKYNQFEEFINTKLHLTREFSDEDEFSNDFDILIASGDQIWNPKCYDFSWLYYFHNIKSKNKVSYAPSIGPKPSLSEEDKSFIKQSLLEFNSIGVRELGSKKVIENLGIDSNKIEIMPDPVLLLDRTDWEVLIKDVNVSINEPYILFYTLSASFETYKAVKKIGKLLDLKVLITKPVQRCDYFGYFTNYFSVGPLEFLKLIQNASYIVTTSFHACVFSSIFSKKFFAIDVQDDNRIKGFLEEYDINDVLISSGDISVALLNSKILKQTTEKFEIKLKENQDKAFEYLTDAFQKK